MYNEKIQLHIYKYENNTFSQIAIIDDYSEISFERNLYQAGQFTITINHNLPNASKFEKGLFIQFGPDPYDFGEIRSISDSIGSDGKGSQNRIISGFDCRYLYKRRIIKNLNNNDTWQMTDKGEICLRSLIYSEAGEGAEVKRRLPITNIIPTSQNAIGKEYSVSEAFTNLYDVLVTIATQSEIGWRVKFENNSLSLECYQGEDKHTTVQFSTDFETLSNGTFTDTNENFSNAVYVGGKGDGSERDIYEGESAINNASPSGFDRFECWDNQSEMNTEDEYSKEALSMLTQYGQTLTVNGNGLAKSIYVYKEQYNVGDIISISFSGKKANVQILSVTEHWTGSGNYGITFSFGKPVNNLADQIKLLLNKIQIASSKANTIDSVKWYEFSNANLSQDKKDVTFNSIGFTGTLSANRTFTFYLDDEGTGSKIYNIYAKNLSGNFNVTLTTGKSGTTNAVIKGGINLVARVYIDVTGNVVLQSMSATDIIESGNNQPATSNGVSEAISDNNTAKGLVATKTDNAIARWDGTAGKLQNSSATIDDNGNLTVKSVLNTFVVIKTGSTYISKISLETLMDWFINTRGLIPKNIPCHVIIQSTWQYANNDILQFAIDGVNYELQLAGVVIEFIGYANAYNDGVFRLLIHSAPTTSYTHTTGYVQFPTSHIAEYTCNGSGDSPVWNMHISTEDTARAISGLVYCGTSANNAAKTAYIPAFKLTKGSKFALNLIYTNTAASALTLNVSGTGARTICVDGVVTSSTSYTLPAGNYNCYYDGTFWCLDTSYEAFSARFVQTTSSITQNSNTPITSGAIFPLNLKLNELYTNNILARVKNLPIIYYADLPSQSTSNVTFLKEWLQYMYDNGLIKDTNVVYTAIVVPNTRGLIIGTTYGEDALRYCSFTLFMLGSEIIRFGYSDYNWYYRVI